MPEQLPTPKPSLEEEKWMDIFWDLNKRIDESRDSHSDQETPADKAMKLAVRTAAVQNADNIAREIFEERGVGVYASLKHDISHCYELAKATGLELSAQNLKKFAERDV